MLLALAAASAAGLVYWLTVGGATAHGGEVRPAESRDAGRALESGPAGEPRRADPAAQGDVHRPTTWPKVYDGTGTIRGRVQFPPGTSMPPRWTVVVGPGQLVEGRDRAVQREQEFEGTDTEFVFEDLPHAGYRVHAEAAGMNSLASEILLVRGSDNVYKTIELRPAGFLDGSVIDAAGGPVEGLLVTLRGETSGEVLETLTSAAGIFRFPTVRDGYYEVVLGNPNAPLVPPRELAFSGSSLQFPQQTIPVTGAAEVYAVGPEDEPLVDALVRGYGPTSFETRTDERGGALVRFLPPGEYGVSVTTDSGASGKATLLVADTEVRARLDVACRP